MGPSQSRRLAAILAADIAGYSALMGADEPRTVSDLKGHQAVVLPMVGDFGGRIIDTAGDGILAEFSSIVNAVECAVAIQRTMADRNTSIQSARRMQFRMGINLGDVIYDDDRIFGDGINVAARLEGLAEPGGLSISEDAWRQVNGKVTVNFVDTGEHSLKNIARPVRVYRAALDEQNVPALAATALPFPDRPSIAVLPFQNMSETGEKTKDAPPWRNSLTKKAPYKEIANGSSAAVRRALWGFSRGGLEEVGQKRLPRWVCCKARCASA